MYFIDIVLDLLFCIVLYCFIVLMFFFFFFCLKVTSFISVELPESEEPKNVVRVGWSTDSESLQLGMLAV